MKVDRTVTKKTGYLIGDSHIYGKGQVLSLGLRFSKGFEDSNISRIATALKTAKNDGYTNIRMVTCHYVGLCIKTGIIEWIKIRETIKPYK